MKLEVIYAVQFLLGNPDDLFENPYISPEQWLYDSEEVAEKKAAEIAELGFRTRVIRMTLARGLPNMDLFNPSSIKLI